MPASTVVPSSSSEMSVNCEGRSHGAQRNCVPRGPGQQCEPASSAETKGASGGSARVGGRWRVDRDPEILDGDELVGSDAGHADADILQLGREHRRVVARRLHQPRVRAAPVGGAVGTPVEVLGEVTEAAGERRDA